VIFILIKQQKSRERSEFCEFGLFWGEAPVTGYYNGPKKMGPCAAKRGPKMGQNVPNAPLSTFSFWEAPIKRKETEK
jgi:hypothetical protein